LQQKAQKGKNIIENHKAQIPNFFWASKIEITSFFVSFLWLSNSNSNL